MIKDTVEDIWYFLERQKEILEDPCGNCGYYECKKFTYNDILKKKYAEFNVINFIDCLKNKKIELEKLNKLRRNEMFNEFSYIPCTLCNKKFFKDDLHLFLEVEKQNTDKSKKAFEVKFIKPCNKCKPKYKRMKRAYYGDEFKKG